jgi:hypothetical protein
MPVNLNEALIRLRKAGATACRAVPMHGQDVHTGQYQIEVQEGGKWNVLIEGLQRSSADDIIKQATNRMILG